MDLFENRDLWLKMQSSGYEFVEKNYSWERCLELCQKAIEIADQTWLKRSTLQAAEESLKDTI